MDEWLTVCPRHDRVNDVHTVGVPARTGWSEYPVAEFVDVDRRGCEVAETVVLTVCVPVLGIDVEVASVSVGDGPNFDLLGRGDERAVSVLTEGFVFKPTTVRIGDIEVKCVVRCVCGDDVSTVVVLERCWVAERRCNAFDFAWWPWIAQEAVNVSAV